MTITRHFYPPYHFAYSQVVGKMDDHDLHVHVLSFQVESKELSHVREILDFRQLRKADRLTVQGMIEITDMEKSRSKDRDFRLAIIANGPLIQKIAKLYAQVIRSPNLRARVFSDDEDQAMAWLGYDRAEADKLRRFMHRHRSRHTR